MTVAEELRGSTLLAQISKDSGLLPEQLISIIATAPLRYKVYKIPKRTIGFREIAQPAKEVKWIQRWVVERLRVLLPIHPAVAAYEPGASIRKNALRHSRGRFLLRMDFSDFFPSITQLDLSKHFARYAPGVSGSDALLIARACLWAKDRSFPLRLCIGAPASPFLSNSIMYDFDCSVHNYVSALGVEYSRYADDLTFSCVGPDVLCRVEEMVGVAVSDIDYPRLSINRPKTVHASRAGRRVVTGIVITPGGQISVGRDRKRLVRAMVHREQRGLLDDEGMDKLNGLINFISSIEPDFRLRVTAWRNQAID